MEFLEEFKKEQEKIPEIQPQHILVAGAGLEILRDLKDRMEKIERKLDEIERRIETIPEDILTEKKFKEELDTSEDIVNKIVSEVRAIAREKSVREIIEDKLIDQKPTLIEMKRMERIRNVLKEHEKLSSSQLSQIMNLSRTRCNEYFKQMENLGMVEPVIIGKEKYYKLSQSIQ